MEKNVKVNILTGFFGSGKTTLISNIIKKNNISHKIAIIQNEFSNESGFEVDILTDAEGNNLGNLYEMPNGCLCCTVKDNIIIFIENLVKVKKDVEIVIIESHGFADISLLIKKFWLDSELESQIYLNSILCIVDCFNFNLNLKQNKELLHSQIISADKILLNKIDMVDNFDEVKNYIISINPLAKIILTEYSNISLEEFSENSYLKDINTFDNNHHHYHEENNIENYVVNIFTKTKELLDKQIGELLWNISEKENFSVIRMKGIFIDENKKRYSIQGLYDLYEINEIKEVLGKVNEETKSKMLFIGKNLLMNESIINNAFK